MARAQRLPVNEFGFAMCRTTNGKLTNGPVTTGTPMSVQLIASCPPATKLVGLFHTHPGGIAYPSQQDVASARSKNIDVLCIEDDRQMACYRLRQR